MISKKLRPVYVIVIILFSLSWGCKKADDNSGLTINAGFACGWGAGEDSLEISRSEIRYVFYIPSKSGEALIRTSRNVTAIEWDEITEAINMDTFVKLNYNTCNICVDGCDEWISIENGTLSNSIRFTKGQDIETISLLQKKLAELRTEFNKL
jgi:hypothetical protein